MNPFYYEYVLLTSKLDDINLALEGSCDEIDCDKYMYKEMLKKKYRPILKHGYSCVPNLKRDKAAIMRLLGMKKFRKYRMKKCKVCSRNVDTLGNSHTIVSFTRPSTYNNRIAYEWKGLHAHRTCSRKVKTPKEWERC